MTPQADRRIIETRAHARVGLLGNPSDGYRGRVLAFALEDFAATVRLEPAPDIQIATHGAPDLEVANWSALTTEIEARGLDGATALIVAERIRSRVAEHLFEAGRHGHHQLTISIGVSTCPEHGEGREVLLEAADKAMYRAKSWGRNKVCSANDLLDGGSETA